MVNSDEIIKRSVGAIILLLLFFGPIIYFATTMNTINNTIVNEVNCTVAEHNGDEPYSYYYYDYENISLLFRGRLIDFYLENKYTQK